MNFFPAAVLLFQTFFISEQRGISATHCLGPEDRHGSRLCRSCAVISFIGPVSFCLRWNLPCSDKPYPAFFGVPPLRMNGESGTGPARGQRSALFGDPCPRILITAAEAVETFMACQQDSQGIRSCRHALWSCPHTRCLQG